MMKYLSFIRTAAFDSFLDTFWVLLSCLYLICGPPCTFRNAREKVLEQEEKLEGVSLVRLEGVYRDVAAATPPCRSNASEILGLMRDTEE
jgi:hypothetical protein